MKDFYALLEISRTAEPDVIRAAYRVVAKRYHPDNQETGNPTMFRAVKEAHDILMDPGARALYDAELKHGRSAGEEPAWKQSRPKPDNRPQVWVNGMGWVDAADVQFPGGPGAAYPQNYPQAYPGQSLEEMMRQASGGIAQSLVDQILDELLYRRGRR